PPPVAATDSIKTEEKKKDEPIAKKDSLPAPPMPLTERWALLFTGGPNLCIKNSSNSLFNIAGEKQPVTYNAAFKAEYKLVRNLSVSAGLNYSYFTAQQDVTLLYFNRFQTTDFIFYSSYGPMAVSMSNMLQGYNPGPGITTLKINYSYTSKLNTLQIPLEAKWYFANTAKINLYTALGGNVMFVLSEQTKLTTINEHVTNTYTFNQVNSSKFNILLMLGLGGDVRLYKKLYFTIDGGFRYGAVNLSTAVGARTYPTYFSINGGLKFKL
ncbi:MAG TPA: outer membrane beta-barrel protein, partial [Bacteroidia bacterium]|nr:outer membrane beta-barrel protein [Bacteroidia bacterium]